MNCVIAALRTFIDLAIECWAASNCCTLGCSTLTSNLFNLMNFFAMIRSYSRIELRVTQDPVGEQCVAPKCSTGPFFEFRFISRTRWTRAFVARVLSSQTFQFMILYFWTHFERSLTQHDNLEWLRFSRICIRSWGGTRNATDPRLFVWRRVIQYSQVGIWTCSHHFWFDLIRLGVLLELRKARNAKE
jgi:hypothetical protein